MKKLILAFALLFVVGCYESTDTKITYLAEGDVETATITYENEDGEYNTLYDEPIPFTHSFYIDDEQHHLYIKMEVEEAAFIRTTIMEDGEQIIETAGRFGLEHVAALYVNTGTTVTIEK